MVNFRLIGAVLVGSAAYLTLKFNLIQTPDGFEEPVLYRSICSMITFSGMMARSLEWFNMGTELINFRNMGSRYGKKAESQTIDLIDTEIDGVKARIYRLKSKKADEISPAMIYYHGGCFCLGDLNGYDLFLMKLVEQTRITIISIEYRLAPENPFPIPVQDCYKATKYIFENSNEFKIDPDRVVLSGDSAGGNTVAYITQRFAKESRKQPKLQALIYPWTQMFNIHLPSVQINKNRGPISFSGITFGKFIKTYLGIYDQGIEDLIDSNQLYYLIRNDKAIIEKLNKYLDPALIASEYISAEEKEFYQNYTHLKASEPGDKRLKHLLQSTEKNEKLRQTLMNVFSAEVSPSIAEDSVLKQLPKAYVIIVEWDPLKDEGLIYAERLKRAGVDVQVKYYRGAFHAMINMVLDKISFTKSVQMTHDLGEFIIANL